MLVDYCQIVSLFFNSSSYAYGVKKNTHRVSSFKLERVKRIELSQSAWKAEVLPLNYTRSYEMAQRRPTLALAYYPRR